MPADRCPDAEANRPRCLRLEGAASGAAVECQRRTANFVIRRLFVVQGDHGVDA